MRHGREGRSVSGDGAAHVLFSPPVVEDGDDWADFGGEGRSLAAPPRGRAAVHRGVGASVDKAAAVELSPTWTSSEGGGCDDGDAAGDDDFRENCSFPSLDDRVDGAANCSEGNSANERLARAERRVKILTIMLAACFAVALSLGISLAIVAARNKAAVGEGGSVGAASSPSVGTDANEESSAADSADDDDRFSELFEYDGTVSTTGSTEASSGIDYEYDSQSTTFASDDDVYTSSSVIERIPTHIPSSIPSSTPTLHPTTLPPSSTPSSSPIDPFYFGNLSITNAELGIRLSAGLSVRLIAQAGQPVQYSDGQESKLKWHELMDGAGIVPLDPGGYVYVSNSERWGGKGGVYGLYFDEGGNVTDYRALLEETTYNCAGGLTPWRTWVSCEEYEDGQCWQVDPNPESPNHSSPAVTNLGGSGGGVYESVAVDNRLPSRPIFFVTEDAFDGAMRRVQVNGTGWDALNTDDATTMYLNILNNTNFEWTANEEDARDSAREHYQYSEGVAFHEEEGKLYFMTKVTKTLYIVDLESLTYVKEQTGKKFYGEGSFASEPDQGLFFGPRRRHLYFTEDGGSTPGVYARLGRTGGYFTVFEGIDGEYEDDETAGVALSPDGTRLYAGFQHSGLLFEFRRDDGLPFE